MVFKTLKDIIQFHELMIDTIWRMRGYRNFFKILFFRPYLSPHLGAKDDGRGMLWIDPKTSSYCSDASERSAQGFERDTFSDERNVGWVLYQTLSTISMAVSGSPSSTAF